MTKSGYNGQCLPTGEGIGGGGSGRESGGGGNWVSDFIGKVTSLSDVLFL